MITFFFLSYYPPSCPLPATCLGGSWGTFYHLGLLPINTLSRCKRACLSRYCNRLQCRFVELRSRIYMTSHNISIWRHRTDLFRLRSFLPCGNWLRNSFFRVEVARLEEPVHVLDFRQSFIAKKSRLKRPPAAGIEPRSPRTKFYEANALPQS